MLIIGQYGAGASVQILLFSVAAIELKRKAPNAQELSIKFFYQLFTNLEDLLANCET
jgi:hypothetical protein